MKRTIIYLNLLLVLALALAACNVPQAPAATQAGNPTQPQPTQNQPTSQPQQPAATTQAPALPDFFNLDSNLDTTDSFRITFTMHIVGKDDKNEDFDELIEMNQEVIRSQNASRVTWKDNQSVDNPEFTIINLGNNAYMEMIGQGQTQCFSFPATDAESQMNALSPNNFMGGISPDTLVARGETVNGLVTDHYTIKQAALTAGLSDEITSASGDVWVTQDGKYTVKYVYEAQGIFKGISSGKTITGTFTMTYDITDINRIAQITVPQSCLEQQQQAADLPMMADASEVSNMSGMINYTSASDQETVYQFYLTEAVAQGWTVSDEMSMEGYAGLTITKGDKVYNVMITPNDGGGSMVLLMKQE